MKNLHKKAFRKQGLSGSSQRHVLGVVAAGLMMLPGIVVNSPVLAQQKTDRNSLSYGELIQKADKGEVKKVELDQTEQVARVYLTGQRPETPPIQVRLLEQNTELINKLKEKKVDFGEVSSTNTRTPLSTYCVNFINKYQTRGVIFGFFKQVPDTGSTHTDEHFHKF